MSHVGRLAGYGNQQPVDLAGHGLLDRHHLALVGLMALHNHDVVAAVVGDGFDAVDSLRKEIIGNLGHDHANHPTAVFLEAERNGVRPVVHPLGVLHHQPLGFGIDFVAVPQRPRYGRG